MSLASFGRNLLNKFAQQGLNDRANFLKNIAVIGWVLSSLAQTSAIMFNDKIPTKEKRFLIPQEIFDGLANATLFWFITSKATNFGKMLVLKKKVLPKSLTKVLANFNSNENNISKLTDSFVKHVKKFGGENEAKIARDAIDGMGVLSGIVGAVVSNNIITPLVRNKLAGICQKKVMEEANEKVYLNPNYGKIDYNKYNYSLKNNATNNVFSNFSSSMRV